VHVDSSYLGRLHPKTAIYGRIDTATRNIVIGRLQTGEIQNAVARLYNVHRSTISRLLQRYQQSGSTADRQRSGRPRITSAVQDRCIRVFHQTSLLWRSTETSASTCKGPMVQHSKGLGPGKLEASLVQR
jgi:IS30 family transposase